MKPFAYLRGHKEGDQVPYLVGGVVEVLFFLILAIFSLTVADRLLLGSSSLASVVSAVLVDLTNGDRSAHQIGGLTVSPVLTAAAQAKANDMASKSYFAHVSPIDGKNSWYWFQQVGYKFSYAGENLAVDFSDSADVERAWMQSPTHRANLLNGNFTEIGIAVAQGTYQGRPTIFVAQMFGTPAETPARTRVITLSASTVPATEPVLAAATSTEEEPALVSATTSATLVLGTEATGLSAPVERNASWWQYLLTSPKTVLQYAYYVLGLIILVVLAYVTELEFHQRHLRHVAAALSLLVLMAGLFVFANYVFFAEPLIAALQR
ncbi:MAG: CAP domain-containing protein [Candidatus Paceibacterota bacterium]